MVNNFKLFISTHKIILRVFFFNFAVLASIAGFPVYLKVLFYTVFFEKLNEFPFVIDLKKDYSFLLFSWKNHKQYKILHGIIAFFILVGLTCLCVNFIFNLENPILLEFFISFLLLALLMRIVFFSCFIIFAKINNPLITGVFLLKQTTLLIVSLILVLIFLFRFNLFNGIFDNVFISLYVFLQNYLKLPNI